MSVEVFHPIYGAGEVIDYRDGQALFSFPGSLRVCEPVSPTEAIFLYKSLPLLVAVLEGSPLSPSELIWRSHRGQGL